MIDTNRAMQNHIGNLHRAVGTDGSGKYSYIISSNDLLKSYYESKKDLSYPLRKEVKRDRYVYNADGLQKDIIDLVNEELVKAFNALTELVSNDIVNAVYSKINGAVSAAGGKHGYISNKSYSTFAAAFGRGLANGLFKIIDKITDYDD